MNTHSQELLNTIDLFAVDFANIDWINVETIVSCDDLERTVIVKIDGRLQHVRVDCILYDAIYKSGEQNVIEQDLGFDDAI